MNKEIFMKNKKKIIIFVVIVAIVLVGFSLLNSTYSLFYHENTALNPDSYSTGLLEITANGKGDNISLANALPLSDDDGSKTDPYTFTITNTGNVDYKFNVKLLSTASSSTTIDAKYIKVKIDDGNATTLASLTNGIIKSDITLKARESIDITIRAWLSSDTPNSQIGKVFNSKIVIDGQAVYTESNYDVGSARETLTRLNKLNGGSLVLATDTPDFSTVSGNNGKGVGGTTGLGDGTKGIYTATDDLGTSYYFRGAVENNYVKFANFYWRIIRINGDGSVRMIYAGTRAYANGDGNSNTDTLINVGVYNSKNDDNAYVGYMYGTAGSSNYDATHSNVNSSDIKNVVDSWYKSKLINYGNYIADVIYCNDRSVANDDSTNILFSTIVGIENAATGIGEDATAYAGLKRNFVSYTPSLLCQNKNDKFTVSEELGNGKLTYPIGLITADELTLAGANFSMNGYYQKNTDFYLYNNNNYWTMSPSLFNTACVSAMNADGRGVANMVDDNVFNFGFRPVISLKPTAINGGKGTMSDPFTVS